MKPSPSGSEVEGPGEGSLLRPNEAAEDALFEDLERLFELPREAIAARPFLDAAKLVGLQIQAGKANPASILDITEDEFDRTIAVNLKSCFNYIKAAAPVMLIRPPTAWNLPPSPAGLR